MCGVPVCSVCLFEHWLQSYHVRGRVVVVLGNFRDMGEHQVVSTLEAMIFVKFLER